MNALLADVGNTRIKWGLLTAHRLSATIALPPDDQLAWTETIQTWMPTGTYPWLIAGTHPARRDALAEWLRNRGDTVRLLTDYRELPIDVRVQFPERVGIDRLLNALAVRAMAPQSASIVIDAGSAVTVDLVDAAGAFQGGAILPGFRLMAQSLHDYTAALPLVLEQPSQVPTPGKNTTEAITAGIHYTLLGGIDRLVKQLTQGLSSFQVFLAGGDSPWLADLECRPVVLGPFLTLEGIRIAAESLRFSAS